MLAVVLIGRSTQGTPGNPVAASSKQFPASSGTTGTGSKGSAGTAKSTGSLAKHRGNAHVATRAAGNAGSSRGGAGGGTGSPSPSIDAASATSPAVNLPVPARFGPVLRTTWARANPGGVKVKASDIVSTVVGSVFYAEQPAVHTFWAISQFVPSGLAESRSHTPAGAALLAEFHGTAAFEKVPGHHWAYVGSFNAGTCPASLPAPVLTAWGLCTVGS